jgi:hypothetical protein
MLENEPQHWSMLHTSLVPTIIGGGFRYNVIPSEARATIDVRLHPDEDQAGFLDQLRKVIDDPNVEVRWGRERYRPAGGSKIDTEAKRRRKNTTTPSCCRRWGRARPTWRRSDRKASSAMASGRRSTPKTALRVSERTAIRSAFSKASCTGSYGFNTTWSWSSRARNNPERFCAPSSLPTAPMAL